ncbi:type III toxin-antitoxin system ToxN/AbiQ family toxin [Paenibacillus campi]|uniref:type III toxin-antitoxin system ToxN/AbiQ family toxin n=1 Tax=Paenibacillus campi TaxID=3106031 RepID=UPI002AFF5F1F|nr:type III toxin-antitoxin system ToxN/AbiQ family toxin [Paenibacillus sp. SGZ-1009]
MEVNKRVTRIEKNSILHTEIETTIDIVSCLSSESAEKVEYVFLNDSFFSQQLDDQVLDKTKNKKDRESRVYVCIKIEDEHNTYLIPLRSEVPIHDRNLKKTFYHVPSTKRPNAGLDFRKIVIVNDPSLYRVEEAQISHKQKKMIHENFNEIKKLAFNYIKGFKKSAKKNRHKRDYEYSFSSLSNFLNELGVQTKDC